MALSVFMNSYKAKLAPVVIHLMMKNNHYLFQPVDNGDQESNIWHPLVVKVSHPLHQLWRWRHWVEGEKLCYPSAEEQGHIQLDSAVPVFTFICENVQASSDQSLRSFRTVFHQKQQLRRVHAHPTDLQKQRTEEDLIIIFRKRSITSYLQQLHC